PRRHGERARPRLAELILSLIPARLATTLSVLQRFELCRATWQRTGVRSQQGRNMTAAADVPVSADCDEFADLRLERLRLGKAEGADGGMVRDAELHGHPLAHHNHRNENAIGEGQGVPACTWAGGRVGALRAQGLDSVPDGLSLKKAAAATPSSRGRSNSRETIRRGPGVGLRARVRSCARPGASADTAAIDGLGPSPPAD